MMQQSGEFKQFQKFLSETKGDFHVLELLSLIHI